MLSSTTPRSHESIPHLGRAWPKAIQGLRNVQSGAWVCGATEGGLHALQRTLPRPSRTHYLGDIMRVAGYSRAGCAGAMSFGAIHSLMGGRVWAFCTHLDFRSGYSYKPGLRVYYKYEYGHVQTSITWLLQPLNQQSSARSSREGYCRPTCPSCAPRHRTLRPDRCWNSVSLTHPRPRTWALTGMNLSQKTAPTNLDRKHFFGLTRQICIRSTRLIGRCTRPNCTQS